VCSVPYLRSALIRGEDGLLRCVNDRDGRNEVTLARLTAERAKAIAARMGAGLPADGAYPDTDSQGRPNSQSDYTGPLRRTTAEDVYNGNVPTGF
jgi:hypothetical protein